jgi:hypothetical protein
MPNDDDFEYFCSDLLHTALWIDRSFWTRRTLESRHWNIPFTQALYPIDCKLPWLLRIMSVMSVDRNGTVTIWAEKFSAKHQLAQCKMCHAKFTLTRCWKSSVENIVQQFFIVTAIPYLRGCQFRVDAHEEPQQIHVRNPSYQSHFFTTRPSHTIVVLVVYVGLIRQRNGWYFTVDSRHYRRANRWHCLPSFSAL